MLLSINTCGSPGSVALGSIDRTSGRVEILAHAEFLERTYSAQLIPKIGEMLAARRAAIRDLKAIVVVRGPGSFTGIRVGLSAAKGLAEASGARVIALSRLALLAGASGLKHVLAAVDAGRGEYYVGEYNHGEPLRETLFTASELTAAVLKPAAGILVLEAKAGAETSLNGAAALATVAGEPQAVKGRLGVAFGNAIYLRAPDAADALRIAAPRFRASLFDDIESLDANYLRRSDAEIFGFKEFKPGAQGGTKTGTRCGAEEETGSRRQRTGQPDSGRSQNGQRTGGTSKRH